MSRISKNPIIIPETVKCHITKNQFSVKGRLGELTIPIHPDININLQEASITITAKDDSKISKMLGTSYRLVSNMVIGVNTGFTRNLEIVGVGYKATMQNDYLVLNLGYSHPINFVVPSDVVVKCDKPTSISVFGYDKQRVGEVAANIRSKRLPEPYKGKGIRYENEKIVLKEGKKK